MNKGGAPPDGEKLFDGGQPKNRSPPPLDCTMMSVEALEEELRKCLQKKKVLKSLELKTELRTMEDELNFGPRYGNMGRDDPRSAAMQRMYDLKRSHAEKFAALEERNNYRIMLLQNELEERGVVVIKEEDGEETETRGVKDSEVMTVVERLTENDPVLLEVSFEGEVIEAQRLVTLTEALKRNHTLKSLSLDNCELGPEGAVAVAESLKVNRSIVSVCLARNLVGEKGAIALAEGLTGNENSVRVLLLSGNDINSEGAKALAACLKNTRVARLDLGRNPVGDEGSSFVAAALMSFQCIHTLDLSYCRIGVDGVTALAKVLETNNYVRCLHLDGNRISDVGMSALADALKINKGIMTLSVMNCGIGIVGGIALGNALKQNRGISVVRVSGNVVGPEGAAALAEALMQNECVTELDLGDNEIGPDGAMCLADALKHNSSLMMFELFGNHIGDSGTTALAEALERETVCCVRHLNLSGNSISSSGAQALAKALLTNRSLHTLELDSNEIGDDGAERIAEALVVNSCLSSLEMSDNKVGSFGAMALALALRKNRCVSNMELTIHNDEEQEGVSAAFASCLAEFNYSLCSLSVTDDEWLDQSIERNRARRQTLWQLVTAGDFAAAERLVVGGVSKVVVHDGLTLFHVALDLGRMDILQLLLRDNVGESFWTSEDLRPGRRAASQEVRSLLEERLLCFFCIWKYKKGDCSPLSRVPRDVMRETIARRVFESMQLPYRARRKSIDSIFQID
jgi:Ran GTPase-activating protein (RanGAP) involved in mRNA processing and transport